MVKVCKLPAATVLAMFEAEAVAVIANNYNNK